MTNREWLATLTDDEFVDWCLGKDFIDFNTFLPIGLYPHLENITSSYTSSFYGLLEWLKQERVEYKIE